jgi:hypothetical protein
MELSAFWEACNRLDSHKIIRLVLNPGDYYRIYSTAPLIPVLWQMNPPHVLLSNLIKICFNIILPSTSVFPKCTSLYIFQLKFCVKFSSLPLLIQTPPILLLNFVTLIISCSRTASLTNLRISLPPLCPYDCDGRQPSSLETRCSLHVEEEVK